MRWCTVWSVCNGAHLYPFLCLQKRGVCGRIGDRLMLMRRSNVCSRTCHRTQASALHLLKTVEVIQGSWVLRYSTAVSWELRRSARCRLGGGSSSTPPRQFRLPGVAPVWSQIADGLRKVIHSLKNDFRSDEWNKSTQNTFKKNNRIRNYRPLKKPKLKQ